MSRRVATLWIVAFLSGQGLALAQVAANGSIRGYLRDEQGGGLPGVVVTTTSPAVATPFTAVSDREGYYRVLGLPPGEYTVTAELEGFSKYVRTNVVVRAGLNLGVDIVLQIGALSETVEVKVESPLLETARAGQAVNVSAELQQALPLGARRHWSEFLNLTPGAVGQDSTSNPSAATYRVHGAGLVSYSNLIDGADMSSAVNPWQAYMSVPADTVSDVQIKTGGMDATTPLGFGAAVSAVTQSGTNELRGSATLAYTSKDWIANNTPGGSSQTMSLVQPEVGVGGPLLRDHLWFYGSYRRREGTLGISRNAADVALLKELVPSFEPFDNDIKADVVFVKVSGLLSESQRVSTFYSYDATPYNQAGAYDADKFNRVVLGGHGYSVRLDSVWKSWLTSQTAFSWNNKTVNRSLLNPTEISQPVYRNVVLSAGQLSGTGQFGVLGSHVSAYQSPYTKWTLTNDWTAYRTGWLGSHEFQAGMMLQPRMNRLDTIRYTNGGVSELHLVLRDASNPAAGAVPFRQVIYEKGSAVGEKGHFADNAFYIQDAWRPVKRLTINVGLRVDHITRHDDLFDVEVQSSTEVGPRFGANYLLTADQRNTVRFSVARVHEAANVNHQTANGSGNFSAGDTTVGTVAVTNRYDFNLDGVWDQEFVTPAASKTNPNRIIDPGYHQPYVDEWTVGYRRQLPGQASIDVGFLHRDFKSRTALVEQNGIYEGSVFKGYANESLNEIYRLTNNIWNWPVYNALEILAAKRSARFQVLGTYTRVWAHMAGTWQPIDPASFIQPSAFPNDKGLLGNDNRSASLNNGYAAGVGAPEWVQHVARVAAAYRAPWAIELAANYSLQQGFWSGPILKRIAAPDPRFGPTTVTLSNGRVVSNPLATTIRFASDTQGEGQWVLPGVHVLNVRVGREFRIGGSRRVMFNVDVLNLPNASGYQGFLSGANQQYSANYKKGGNIQPPRTWQFSVRFSF